MDRSDQEATMLRNPRDPAGRVLCPICNAPIETEHVIQEHRIVYHRECWRPTEPDQG